MIVCICNNVSDQKIRQAVDSGITSMTGLRDHLDIGTSCGKCHACAKRVLRECLADGSQTQSMLFQRNILAA
jgi:bacterioferritin-associated ferredoxin